mgnify:CR=1 FL=1
MIRIILSKKLNFTFIDVKNTKGKKGRKTTVKIPEKIEKG